MLVPKVSVGKVSKAVTSPEIIAIGSAVIAVPLLATHMNNLISRIPFAKDHVTAALIIISIIILLVSTKMKSGVLRSVVIGFAGGNLIIAVLGIPAVKTALAGIGLR